MKIKILIILIVNLLFVAGGFKPAFAAEHVQKDGLFSMSIPNEWHWIEFPEEIIITYPDGKTMAMDIQLIASGRLSKADIKKALKESNDKMIKGGIEAHQGTLIDNKEIQIAGVYATQLDFKTAPPDPINVAYISFFNKGYAFTITYGSGDDKIRSEMDDVVATLEFK